MGAGQISRPGSADWLDALEAELGRVREELDRVATLIEADLRRIQADLEREQRLAAALEKEIKRRPALAALAEAAEAWYRGDRRQTGGLVRAVRLYLGEVAPEGPE